MKLLIVQPSPASLRVLFLSSKYSPQLHHSLFPSLGVRDQVSHPCKTAGKILLLCTLILQLLDRREDKTF